MASFVRLACGRIVLTGHRSLQSFLYSTSTQASSSASEDHTTQLSNNKKPSIPFVPKRRDPDAVLKALASTVEPVEMPLYMRGRGIADPLYPRGRGYHMIYIKHLEAGKAAAQTIIEKWPDLFPNRPTDPSPFEKDLAGKSQLECLITKGEASEAWTVYQTMRQEGEEVSLSVENDLLALVAYRGLGNTTTDSEDSSDVYVHWPSGTATKKPPPDNQTPIESAGNEERHSTRAAEKESSDSSEESEASIDKDERITEGYFSVWSTDNVAEIMFQEMKQKDGGTYEALIQGLIKFNRYGRAFDLFQEMRDSNHQASVGTYNLLLSALKGYRVFNIAISLVKQMNSKPVVQPNITTMNHLLRISSKLEASTKPLSLKIMREIFHLGLEPTLSTFVNLLVAHSSERYGSTNKERAAILEQVVDYIENHKHILTLREETDIVFFIQAFVTAQKVGSADLAIRLKNLAAIHGNFLIDNINYVMGLYLSTLCHHAPMETTMVEYHSLVPKVTVPLEWVYRDLFVMCNKHQSAETALELWIHTKRFLVPLTQVETLNQLCGALTHIIPQASVHTYLEALNEVWEIFKNSGNKPSELLISAMVRAHVLDDNLDEAWRYFKHFNTPSFLALVTLLKKYDSLRDKMKIVEILEMMARYGMSLPSDYLTNILKNTGVTEEKRQQLLSNLTGDEANPQWGLLEDEQTVSKSKVTEELELQDP